MKLAIFFFFKSQTTATDNSLKLLLCFFSWSPQVGELWLEYYYKIAVALDGFIFIQLAFKKILKNMYPQTSKAHFDSIFKKENKFNGCENT